MSDDIIMKAEMLAAQISESYTRIQKILEKMRQLDTEIEKNLKESNELLKGLGSRSNNVLS